jgi:hypothetical protein
MRNTETAETPVGVDPTRLWRAMSWIIVRYHTFYRGVFDQLTLDYLRSGFSSSFPANSAAT